MKSLFHLLIIISFAVLVNACSNDFLDENLTAITVPVGESSIIISPAWDEDSYLFSLPIAKNVAFTIEEAPGWLQLESKTGDMTYTESTASSPHSIGFVRAKANVNRDFEKIGIYIEYMKVKAAGVVYRVPVYYVTEGKPKVSVDRKMIINYSSTSTAQLQLRNTGDGILIWDIVSMPAWLNVDIDKLNPEGIIIPKDGQYSIPLTFNTDADLDDNQLSGTIMLRTNDKENEVIAIQVTANLGSPVVYFPVIFSGRIDFGVTAWAYSYTLQNQGNGWLTWQFTDLPEWLVVNKSKGNLLSYYAETIQFSCVAEKLAPGQNTDTIQLKTNDPNRRSFSIVVSARGAGNNASTSAIAGKVVDAAINRSRNLLVYATAQPNKLIFFDLGTKKVTNEIALSKAPTCFTFAEDFSTAAVGHEGMISAVNLTNYTITKTIELSNTVNDVAWADSSLYCYTEVTSYSDYIYWVDIATGTLSSTLARDVDGRTRIKKVPAQPFMIATRQQSSPTGFLTFSIADRKLKSYSHMTLSDFWFSENGEYIFALGGNVYRTSTPTGATDTFNATINAIGKLKDSSGGTQYYPWWADHSSVTKKLFTINYHYSYQYVIHQFDDNDYVLEKSYPYDKFYQLNPQSVPFEVQAHYVFANREGTELAVLRKGKADDNNVWSMEMLKVK